MKVNSLLNVYYKEYDNTFDIGTTLLLKSINVRRSGDNIIVGNISDSLGHNGLCNDYLIGFILRKNSPYYCQFNIKTFHSVLIINVLNDIHKASYHNAKILLYDIIERIKYCDV